MDSWITSLLLIGAAAALSTWLAPGRNEKMGRMTELAIALVVLCGICRPLTAWNGLPSFRPGDLPGGIARVEDADPDTRAAVVGAVNEGIRRDIGAKFPVARDGITADATVTLSNGEMAVTALTLTVRGAARTADLVALKQYAESTYGCPCRMEVDE